MSNCVYGSRLLRLDDDCLRVIATYARRRTLPHTCVRLHRLLAYRHLEGVDWGAARDGAGLIDWLRTGGETTRHREVPLLPPPVARTESLSAAVKRVPWDFIETLPHAPRGHTVDGAEANAWRPWPRLRELELVCMDSHCWSASNGPRLRSVPLR